jgi:hypothetical protein
LSAQDVCTASTPDGPREHIPDFFADTRSGRWLIDVRPAGLIAPRDEDAFAATTEVASLMGWGYQVVTGWNPVAAAAVEAFSAQRTSRWVATCRPVERGMRSEAVCVFGGDEDDVPAAIARQWLGGVELGVGEQVE